MAASRGYKIRLRIHPLFLAVGVVSACTGQLLLFLAATLAAVEHECAHSFVARRYGYSLDKVVLMPYGAVLSGDTSGMGRRQEVAVTLAGPLANGLTGLFFVALWWLYPESYPYTDVAAQVSFSLFFVNLLPAWPLDGGRILRLLLRPVGEKRARVVCCVVTLCIAAAVIGWCVYTCFSSPSFSALLFSLLLAAGAFGGGRYRPLTFSRKKSFARGVEELRIALSADCTVQDAIRFLREDKYLTLLLFEGEQFFAELTEEEYLSALHAGEYAKPLRELVPKL